MLQNSRQFDVSFVTALAAARISGKSSLWRADRVGLLRIGNGRSCRERADTGPFVWSGIESRSGLSKRCAAVPFN